MTTDNTLDFEPMELDRDHPGRLLPTLRPGAIVRLQNCYGEARVRITSVTVSGPRMDKHLVHVAAVDEGDEFRFTFTEPYGEWRLGAMVAVTADGLPYKSLGPTSTSIEYPR